ncbi:hypothetical protein WN51_10458 [Melipona quadrifasciata]|uniref:Uncharacterized protein n=1 Tax=Melipona quadrifasciata TaxID=166423 RepID=A0A0N0BI85_9HYME|nr:hypothetical protein WN51_10458 [Melipona quadrifasciata]
MYMPPRDKDERESRSRRRKQTRNSLLTGRQRQIEKNTTKVAIRAQKEGNEEKNKQRKNENGDVHATPGDRTRKSRGTRVCKRDSRMEELLKREKEAGEREKDTSMKKGGTVVRCRLPSSSRQFGVRCC